MFRRIIVFLGLTVLMAVPVIAHHPFSEEYDWKKPVTISGAVTRVEWSNPHAHLYVDAKDASGQMKTWTFELGGINALMKAGWSKDMLKHGDMITVDAWLSKSSSTAGNIKSVKMASGRELSGASSIADPSGTEKKRISSN